ncbi:MAG: CBS domain-containing protein [Chloroflexi bacterium]|nr:CBS domain-containing protein [Chloroflexota bacterium]
MDFSVQHWMVDMIVYIDPESTVEEALSIMRRRYIHSLIVKKASPDDEYGIVTSTDISDKIVADEADPCETRVKEIMNKPLITIEKGRSLKECAKLMKKHHIHHLPVVDENNALVGMISATDFLVAAEAMCQKPGEFLT